MSRFLCLSDDNYRLIAFYLVKDHWLEAVALCWKRKRLLDVDEWTKAVPCIMHSTKVDALSLQQLHWRVLKHKGMPSLVEWKMHMTDELWKHLEVRIDYEFGGFLVPYTRITKARLGLQNSIREELSTVELSLIYLSPYLHLQDLESVKVNRELYEVNLDLIDAFLESEFSMFLPADILEHDTLDIDDTEEPDIPDID
jgi:hypothetical protein